MNKPSLNQVSFLKDTLKEDDMVKTQFNTDTLFDALIEVDLHTFNLIKWLYRNKKQMALRNKLIEVGVKANI